MLMISDLWEDRILNLISLKKESSQIFDVQKFGIFFSLTLISFIEKQKQCCFEKIMNYYMKIFPDVNLTKKDGAEQHPLW